MSIPCDVPGCTRYLMNKTGKTQHMRRMHPDFEEADPPLPSEHLHERGSADPSMPPLDPASDAEDSGAEDEFAGSQGGHQLYRGDQAAALMPSEHNDGSDNGAHLSGGEGMGIAGREGSRDLRFDEWRNADDRSDGGSAGSGSDGEDSDNGSRYGDPADDGASDASFEGPDWAFDDDPDDDAGSDEGAGFIDAPDDMNANDPNAVDPYGEADSPPPPSPLPRPSSVAPPGSDAAGTESRRSGSEEGHPSHFAFGGRSTRMEVHPIVNGSPCDARGQTLPPGSPPPPPSERSGDDWSPFKDRVAFELSDLLYRKEQMPAGNINELLELWTASLLKHGGSAPYRGQEDLYRTIDNIPLGDVKWESFTLSYSSEVPASGAQPWMTDKHSVFYRDPRAVIRRMLENPDFKDEIDFAPFREFDHNSKRRLQNFMGGEWAWRQANIISGQPEAQGSSFVPIILGSDKTTVSVATGQNEYYPVYCSIGNVHNNVRRAHRNAVALIAFLAIPKTNKRDANSADFRKFRRQLFHTSLSRILQSLSPWMEKPEVVRCGDGHFRKVIYGIGPYIADYPEQALLACIVQGWCPVCMLKRDEIEHGGGLARNREHTEYLVQAFELGDLWDEYGIVGDVVPFTNNFPRADIHELLAPDILHQLIKGTFKDHLVTWVEQYLKQEHGDVGAAKILAQIDRRIATVPPFSKLRHFHEGRGFKQWTGDDSKALMKVYLPAIDGLLPPDIVKSIRRFLEFCYLVRRDSHNEETLNQLEESLEHFVEHREFFRDCGVRSEGFSLPRQHSCVHYVDRIWEFGSPNGLCSSITESKHIKAVKEPWRRSSRYEALEQMLMTNQRLDKLAAARVDFTERGMLEGSCLAAALLALDPEQREGAQHHAKKTRKKKDWLEGRPGVADEDGAVSGPTVMAYTAMATTPQRKHGSTPEELEAAFSITDLRAHIRRFLYHELNRGQPTALSGASLSLGVCPAFENVPLTVYHSAASTFYAPSDPCGVGGMHREIIRANPLWRSRHPRFDCVFVNKANNFPGFLGMEVARVRMFFSFTYRRRRYPCAIVHWFRRIYDAIDEDTGMWAVKPSYLRGRIPLLSVIHLNSIVRAAHLIGSSVGDTVSDTLQSHEALDKFSMFYVNKYIDHHAFELLHSSSAPGQ